MKMIPNCQTSLNSNYLLNDKRITQNNGDEAVEIDGNTPEVDSTSASASPSSNDWKHSEGENKKQHALRQSLKIFKPPRKLEIERLGNNSHDWTHLRSFELFSDG